MTVYGTNIGVPSYSNNIVCGPDPYGCPSNYCPDFVIKRHDTRPPFRLSLNDCVRPLDLSAINLIAEVNMWAKAKLKTAVLSNETILHFADNIGFEQVMIGDIIVTERVRKPEHMLVTDIDENSYGVTVVRGHNNTLPSDWKRGSSVKIFRMMNEPVNIESVFDDVQQEDGTILENQLSSTNLIVNWTANSTCLPGCYWLEFKLLEMETEDVISTPSTTPESFGCTLGDGVRSVRRFPIDGEGFLVKITDSPTSE